MFIRGLFFVLLSVSAYAQKPVPPALHSDPEGALSAYRENLAQLRKEHHNHHDLPDLKFFLFGMGDRLKLIYRSGRLLNALTGNIEEQWDVKHEIIVPSEYLVHLTLADGLILQIREDETGIWLLQPSKRPKLIPGTRSRVSLPRFSDKAYGPVLRVLHQEVLVNIVNGRPIPNFLVYTKPKLRNAASMAMVIRETDNLHLIRDWIMAIRSPFNRVHPSIVEPDNAGQTMFLISLVSDKTHPAVAPAVDSLKQFRKGDHIIGKTDNAEHPVFQTKWIKYGLKSLGLPDPYVIPTQYDSYSSLFWWGYKDQHVSGKHFDESISATTPHFVWAEDHFYDRADVPQRRGTVGNVDYPLSWEQKASDAHYPGLTVLDKGLAKQKLAFPHTSQAAEMFLLLSSR
ncbi:hypothetical protein ACFSUS_27535 [Spirosoma soli]|uniref:Uncharacterized protein n=1 Tax=Spirosoma soli TaxID=1770529 RepID=A0ABW5MBP9_9BACT